MIQRLLIFLTLLLTAAIFARLALNYTEHSQLTKLATHYAGQGPAELGAPNLVTAVVVTYRGLDTLGEVTVLFISAAGVGLMLRRRQQVSVEAEDKKPASEIVVTAAQLLMPMVFLFGVYVFVNGHLSPGGGFQGGAIIAAGSLLLLLALPGAELRQRLIQNNPVFAAVDQIEPAQWGAFGEAGLVDPAPLASPMRNYYMTNPISRASETMAQCTAALIDRNQGEATGTHG